MSGDNLTILLFAWGIAVTLGLEGRKEAGWRRWTFWSIASLLIVAGLFWPRLADVWPQGEEFGRRVATDPTAWFVLFMGVMLLIAMSGHRDAKPSSRSFVWRQPIYILSLLYPDDFQTEERATQESREATARALRAFALLTGQPPEVIKMAQENEIKAREQAAKLSLKANITRDWMNRLLEKELESGKLIAQGFPAIGITNEPVNIPSAQWRVMHFNREEPEKATGGGFGYHGIRIALTGSINPLTSHRPLLKRLMLRAEKWLRKSRA